MCVSVCVPDRRPEIPPAAPPPAPQGRRQGEAKSLRRSPRLSAQILPSNPPRLVASAGSDHHVAVLLEDDVGAVVEVEHRDGVELRGGAAGLGNRVRVDEVNLGGEGGRGEGCF